METDADEIKDSVKEAITQRIKSPAIGAFACAWVISNWQFLSVLCFSSKPIEERLVLLLSDYSSRTHMLYYPLIAAAAFVLVGPWIEFCVMIVRAAPEFLIARWKMQQDMRIAEISFRRSKYRFMEDELMRSVRVPEISEKKKPNQAPEPTAPSGRGSP